MPQPEYKHCQQCGQRFEKQRKLSATQWADRRFHSRRCAALWKAAQRDTHGATTHLLKSPEYQSWIAMKTRCFNLNTAYYKH